MKKRRFCFKIAYHPRFIEENDSAVSSGNIQFSVGIKDCD